MKAVIVGLLLGFASCTAWDVPSTLPTCYTGLPFNIEVGNSDSYSYEAHALPSWAALDKQKGVITGSSDQAGAWPISIKVSDKNKNSANLQYIINVVDVKSDSSQVWASNSTSNYYDRKV